MRPTKLEYFLNMATLVSSRSTCKRRAVGCVLVDGNDYVIATGYNGVGSGQIHCISKPCAGANYKTGEGLDKCEAIHAEQNAILQCRDVQKIKTAFITLSPCVTCAKLLLNTSCRTIIFDKEYINTDAERIWKNAGRNWIKSADAALGTKFSVDTTTDFTRLVLGKYLCD